MVLWLQHSLVLLSHVGCIVVWVSQLTISPMPPVIPTIPFSPFSPGAPCIQTRAVIRGHPMVRRMFMYRTELEVWGHKILLQIRTNWKSFAPLSSRFSNVSLHARITSATLLSWGTITAISPWGTWQTLQKIFISHGIICACMYVYV